MLAFGIKSVVVQASYIIKRRTVTVTAGPKNRIHVKGRKLDDPKLFPIPLRYDEMGWKLKVGFDWEREIFTLSVNGNDFWELPYQAVMAPFGP